MSRRIAVFGYGSLVSARSAAVTLGRPVEVIRPAQLRGWRRRWTLIRDNRREEKTFIRADGGGMPLHCLGLNLEPAGPGDGDGPNGVLVEVSEAELERLDVREMRYDRIDVTEAVASAPEAGFDVVLTYIAKPHHHAPEPPPGSVILAPYVRAIESGFAELGARQLDLYRVTTQPHPVEVIEPILVRDDIPPGNPRDW